MYIPLALLLHVCLQVLVNIRKTTCTSQYLNSYMPLDMNIALIFVCALSHLT